jgi:succinyl-CoA synthetase alpha subunit
MGILIDQTTSVVVQGITGREGSLRATYMKEYGTHVIAGSTPGRGGGQVAGIPVYNSVAEAVEQHGLIDAAVAFVPGPDLLDAVLEAIDAGVRLVVAPVERVPIHDIMVMASVARDRGVRILGPGTIGVINPGRAVLGWLGADAVWARTVFPPGPVGVISRSGGQSGTIPWVIREAGMGMSTVVHVGTEVITCTSMAEILSLFQEDQQTEVVAAFGEIGGSHEEEAARLIAAGGFTKPLVIFIAGAWAPAGMRFSHASSLIERGHGSAKDKVASLREVRAHVVDRPEQIAPTVARLLGASKKAQDRRHDAKQGDGS